MNSKFLKGLDGDLARQQKQGGGVSKTLKSIKQRPEGNYHSNAQANQYLDNPEYEKNWDRIFGKKKKI